ncbi:Clp protease N-terminal domain-containing protein [Streptomyces sp. NPDC014636]|uniref:Clp protease N-terminal domain-containing protein n=1 Tax=Streptomyces sp. NPDC014636 TaxID=3364876 RepID=UPI0036F63387
MQPRTARLTAHGAAVPHQDGAAWLDAAPAAVVAGARRRAVRDRDRQTDTAHLLHALLEHDPEVRAAVGEPRRLARLLGYLAQRSIGYGLRWQGSVEDSGAIPPAAAPAGPEGPTGAAEDRTAAAPPVPAADRDGAGRHRPGRDAGSWSPAAAMALADARARARRRGAPRVTGTDLLAALAANPRCRAVEVLERAGVPARELAARIEAGGGEYASEGEAIC